MYQAIEFGVRNQVGCLLAAQRSPQHPRQADHRLASARQTARSIVFADQFAGHAKHRGLQTEKVSVTRLVRIHLAEFSCLERSKKLKLGSDQQEVTRLVQPVDKRLLAAGYLAKILPGASAMNSAGVADGP